MSALPNIIPEKIKVFSIDPGVSSFGWSCLEYNTKIDKLEVMKYGTLKASKLAQKQKELVKAFDSRVIALNEIRELILDVAGSFVPHFFVTEDTFFNSKFPNAFGALLMCICTIERTLFDLNVMYENSHNTARSLYKLSPRTIKNIATGNSLSYKENMLQSLKENPKVFFHSKTPIEEIARTITEHEVDAISCGYSFIESEVQTFINEGGEIFLQNLDDPIARKKEMKEKLKIKK